ncbi:MAG: hypothetical protein M3145_12920, partial [Pseudomonadota bacterium]|nr:hypothetical protein [Pseudomonadota bacterium]
RRRHFNRDDGDLDPHRQPGIDRRLRAWEHRHWKRLYGLGGRLDRKLAGWRVERRRVERRRLERRRLGRRRLRRRRVSSKARGILPSPVANSLALGAGLGEIQGDCRRRATRW